jgi:predicted porin
MKKSLLATTALAALGAVAVAGPALAAEKLKIGVGGYMQQWFGYADSKDSVVADRDGFDQKTDAEIHFKGETTLDNGLTFGVNVQLEAQTDGDQIDEQYVYVAGSFGRFLMGSENSAFYLMHYGLPSMGVTIDSGDANEWIQGINFTMARTNGRGNDNDSEKITYFTPRFQGFQLGVSYVPQQNQDADAAPAENDGTRDDGFAIGANFQRSFNDFKVELSTGYQDFGDDKALTTNAESYNVALRLGYAGFTVAGGYGIEDRQNLVAGDEKDAEQETWHAGVAYGMGPWGVSLGWIGSELSKGRDDEQDVFELGAKYALGPGIDLKGSVLYGERDDTNGVKAAEGFAIVGGLDLSF